MQKVVATDTAGRELVFVLPINYKRDIPNTPISELMRQQANFGIVLREMRDDATLGLSRLRRSHVRTSICLFLLASMFVWQLLMLYRSDLLWQRWMASLILGFATFGLSQAFRFEQRAIKLTSTSLGVAQTHIDMIEQSVIAYGR
jgi:hypothetical protein